MRRSLTIAVALAIAFLTLQAAYWPLAISPGVKLHAWQMHWAAEIGYRIGAPVLGVTLFSTFTGLTQHVVTIVLAIAWSAAVAWVVNVGIRNFQHSQAKHIARSQNSVTSPAVSTPTVPDAAVQTPAQLARAAVRPSAPSD